MVATCRRKVWTKGMLGYFHIPSSGDNAADIPSQGFRQVIRRTRFLPCLRKGTAMLSRIPRKVRLLLAAATTILLLWTGTAAAYGDENVGEPAATAEPAVTATPSPSPSPTEPDVLAPESHTGGW
jgi:hypothetical protein